MGLPLRSLLLARVWSYDRNTKKIDFTSMIQIVYSSGEGIDITQIQLARTFSLCIDKYRILDMELAMRDLGANLYIQHAAVIHSLAAMGETNKLTHREALQKSLLNINIFSVISRARICWHLSLCFLNGQKGFDERKV